MTKTYKQTHKGETIWLYADFSRPESPMYVAYTETRKRNPSEEDWQSTQFQVADFRHDYRQAFKLIKSIRGYWK